MTGSHARSSISGRLLTGSALSYGHNGPHIGIIMLILIFVILEGLDFESARARLLYQAVSHLESLDKRSVGNNGGVTSTVFLLAFSGGINAVDAALFR